MRIAGMKYAVETAVESKTESSILKTKILKKINWLEHLKQWHCTSAYLKTAINHSIGIVISYVNHLKMILMQVFLKEFFWGETYLQ